MRLWELKYYTIPNEIKVIYYNMTEIDINEGHVQIVWIFGGYSRVHLSHFV